MIRDSPTEYKNTKYKTIPYIYKYFWNGVRGCRINQKSFLLKNYKLYSNILR